MSVGRLELDISQPQCSALTTTPWDTPYVGDRILYRCYRSLPALLVRRRRVERSRNDLIDGYRNKEWFKWTMCYSYVDGEADHVPVLVVANAMTP